MIPLARTATIRPHRPLTLPSPRVRVSPVRSPTPLIPLTIRPRPLPAQSIPMQGKVTTDYFEKPLVKVWWPKNSSTPPVLSAPIRASMDKMLHSQTVKRETLSYEKVDQIRSIDPVGLKRVETAAHYESHLYPSDWVGLDEFVHILVHPEATIEEIELYDLLPDLQMNYFSRALKINKTLKSIKLTFVDLNEANILEMSRGLDRKEKIERIEIYIRNPSSVEAMRPLIESFASMPDLKSVILDSSKYKPEPFQQAIFLNSLKQLLEKAPHLEIKMGYMFPSRIRYQEIVNKLKNIQSEL